MKAPFYLLANLLLIGLMVGGCGPRVGDEAGGIAPSGEPPGIVGLGSLFPNPPSVTIEGTANGAQVVFPIRFIFDAIDNDRDMRQVVITVSYTDCNGQSQSQELIHELSAAQQVVRELVLDITTVDKIRVPQNCFAQGDRFSVRGQIVDRRGNFSINSVRDDLIIQVGQGSSGG